MQGFEDDEEGITGINVTPLVDVTLVLLIIFMVTARFIAEPSIGVNLPKAGHGTASDAAANNVFLTINASQQIFLNSKQVDRKDLPQAIAQLQQEKPGFNLILRADRSVTHGEVMSVLDEVRNQGVTQFGIAVEGQ